MNFSKLNAFSKKSFIEECKTFFSATFIALLVFGSTYAYDAYSANPEVETLTVTINAAVTFAVSTDVFGALDPGTYKYATSTLAVTTNANSGWNVTMIGDNQGSNAASTTLFIVADPATDNKIPDGVEWVPNAATTSAGNAVAISAGDDFLYFRVMSASGSIPFRSTAWWGSDDTPFTNARWAGIASTTAANKRIGSVGSGVYNSSVYLNTVQYYLDVGASQKQGSYTGTITYTWVSGA